MELIKYSLGLDMSKDEAVARFVSIDKLQNIKTRGSRKFVNTEAGLDTLQKWIEKKHKDKSVPLVICMEVTGVYHETFLFGLEQAGYFVSLVLPNKARRFMQSHGMHSKTDKIDSEGLARLGAERQLKRWKPGAAFYMELRAITRTRQSFQEHKILVNNQLHAQNHRKIQNQIIKDKMIELIELLGNQITSLDKELLAHVRKNEEVIEKVERIAAIHGVAVLTVATIIAETFGFEAFENTNQLISYCGLDVVENQSGKRNGKTRISKRGNARLRRALYMPSLTAKEQGRFAAIYNRTFERHGIGKKSLVAVQRKILVTIFALWRNGQKYDPNHVFELGGKKSTPALAGVQ